MLKLPFDDRISNWQKYQIWRDDGDSNIPTQPLAQIPQISPLGIYGTAVSRNSRPQSVRSNGGDIDDLAGALPIMEKC